MNFKITDSASASADFDIEDTSLLSQLGATEFAFHTAAFVANVGKPVDQSGFKTATFGGNFTAPSRLLLNAAKLAINSDVSGEFGLVTCADKKLFGDDFTPEIAIASDECWVSLEIDTLVDGRLSATVDGVGVSVDASTAACFKTYTLLKASGGKFPSLGEALVSAMGHYSVNYSLESVRQQPPGTVNVSDLKGTVTYSGSYSVPISVNSLASANLPFNDKIDVNPGATLKLAGQIALSGEFVVRSHKVSDQELHFGVYKKKNSILSASFTASAGIQTDLAGQDLITTFIGAVFPAVDLSKAGITGKDADALRDAVQGCLNHSLSLSMNATCSASLTDEAAVAYSINLSGGDAKKTDTAIAFALRGDWSALAGLPNATPLRNILRDTEKFEHKIVINLLGIYNAQSVGQFVKSCTVLHDADGQVLITDKETASRVCVASAPLLADADKLRSALSEAFLTTVAYVAGGSGSAGGAKLKDFSVSQTYLRFKDNMSQNEMRQQVLLGKALKLITDGSWDAVLAAHARFGHAKVSATATYDAGAAMKLFFADPARRTPRAIAALERIGRDVMAALIDPADPTGPARIKVLKDDAIWSAMDETGAVGSFGHIPGLRHLQPNELADVGTDWVGIRWWANAMANVAPKLKDVLAALEPTTAQDPTTDPNFMKRRAALASVLGQVARRSHAAFAGGWGVAVMAAVSEFTAPLTMDICADGKISAHYESTNSAAPPKPAYAGS